ncbi:hypothetical protein ABIE13_004541 [Ottowia thiooxydans]|uniref:Uncharacterized protein n=1 Tax=Ottowia thiooxydans TaxID=219182 RepID=A0ABV2QEF2_9BURK
MGSTRTPCSESKNPGTWPGFLLSEAELTDGGGSETGWSEIVQHQYIHFVACCHRTLFMLEYEQAVGLHHG